MTSAWFIDIDWQNVRSFDTLTCKKHEFIVLFTPSIKRQHFGQWAVTLIIFLMKRVLHFNLKI